MANEGLIASAINNTAEALFRIAKAIENLASAIDDKNFEITINNNGE